MSCTGSVPEIRTRSEEGPVKIVKHNTKQRNALYATAADFCRIFAEDMKSLYFLSLVLTADPEKAEQCFVSGLDDCHAGNPVFREWARSWARRVVIKNAIRMTFSGRESASQVLNPAAAKTRTAERWSGEQGRSAPVELSVVLGMPAFERFAFVMSVLESYSASDCALLLGCTRESLVAARVRALELMGRSTEEDTTLGAEALHDRGSIGDRLLRAGLATPA
jgi:hypothetical protein